MLLLGQCACAATMKPRSIFTIESCDVTHLQCYSKYGNSGVSNIQSQTYPTTQGGAKVT